MTTWPPEQRAAALECKPAWDACEEFQRGDWCDLVIKYIIGGCDNQSVFNLMGLGQSPFVTETARQSERSAFFMAFDYARAVNWIIVKQPIFEIVNGQKTLTHMR